MQEFDTWILEITCQGERNLNLSLFEKGQTFPLKSISSTPVDFAEIEQLNNEVIAIINKSRQRKTLAQDSIEDFKKNTRLLYDLLFSRQIKNRLDSLGSVNLVLSLDERLIAIPWELLFNGQDFLCFKFNLGRSIHTRNSEHQPRYRNISSKPRMLILANPTGDLPSAYREGLYIKNCLTKTGSISVDFKAQDISSNYVRKNLRDYDIVHFAGHCEYNSEKPEESGWIVADGWVSARDFLVLSESAALPSIIFANACQSARAENNLLDLQAQSKVYGLAQAFLFAGVRHYLGSFWRVEDDFSGKFAEEFYNQTISAQSIGKAVRLARLRLFREYGIAAVAWAGYVLYGDPGFVLSSLSGAAAKKKRFHGVEVSSDGARRRLAVISKKKAIIFGLTLAVLISGMVAVKILPTLNPKTYFLFSQAKQSYTQGDNSKVFSLAERIIKQDSSYLPILKLRGDVYFRLGRSTEALSDYFDYARLSQKKKDYKHLAAAYTKIAWTTHMWGDYKKSYEFYQKALNISRKYHDKLNEADAMERLAVWYIDKGDNEAAFSLLIKSLDINRQRSHDPEHRFNLACDYFTLAFLYMEKEEYATAKDFFKKSEEIFESLGEIPELSDYYFDMGEIALLEKNYNLALEFYQKGLALDKRLNHRFNLSSDYWMIGEFYWETGKIAQAENYFKEAIILCRQINNRPVLAGVYYDLGMMYKELGEDNKAKEYYSQALKLYKDIDTPDYQQVRQEYLSFE